MAFCSMNFIAIAKASAQDEHRTRADGYLLAYYLDHISLSLLVDVRRWIRSQCLEAVACHLYEYRSLKSQRFNHDHDIYYSIREKRNLPGTFNKNNLHSTSCVPAAVYRCTTTTIKTQHITHLFSKVRHTMYPVHYLAPQESAISPDPII